MAVGSVPELSVCCRYCCAGVALPERCRRWTKLSCAQMYENSFQRAERGDSQGGQTARNSCSKTEACNTRGIVLPPVFHILILACPSSQHGTHTAEVAL